jgi:hypothetical protein
VVQCGCEMGTAGLVRLTGCGRGSRASAGPDAGARVSGCRARDAMLADIGCRRGAPFERRLPPERDLAWGQRELYALTTGVEAASGCTVGAGHPDANASVTLYRIQHLTFDSHALALHRAILIRFKLANVRGTKI